MFNLQAEEKCGHLITEETKKLWQVELGCLEEVKRICKKHNIKYFAGCGTLLGAVRHQGFIPWDDDIDLVMPREDYARFCQIAPKEIQAPYFFQHYSTQDVNNWFVRIRNSNTTGCTQHEYDRLKNKTEYNCGIFLDIFPLNYVPENKLKIKWQALCKHVSTAALYGYLSQKHAKAAGEKPKLSKSLLISKLFRLFMDEDKLKQTVYNARDMYKSEKKVGLISSFGHLERFIWDSNLFDEVVELPFEDTTICCPKEYDKILRKSYGDYNVFVKGTAIHTFLIIDPDTPYVQKLKEYAAEHPQQA